MSQEDRLFARRTGCELRHHVVTAAALMPLFAGRCKARFVVDAEAVGDAVDVVEVADHLHRDRDRRVVKAVATERLDVLFRDAARGEGELDRVVAQGAVGRVEFSLPIVMNQLLGQRMVPGLPTEVLCVRERSVIALVDIAHDGREHLPPGGAQGIVGLHHAHVELHRTLDGSAVAAHYLDDVGDAAAASPRRLVDALQDAGRLGLADLLYERHGRDIVHASGPSTPP